MERKWNWCKFACWQFLFEWRFFQESGVGIRRCTQRYLRMKIRKGFLSWMSGWRINLSLSDLSQNPHTSSVKTKANLGLIVVWEKVWDWMVQINFSPSPSPIPCESVFPSWLPTRIPWSVSSNLSSVLGVKVLSPSSSSFALFVFWLWDSFHSSITSPYLSPLLVLEELACSPAWWWKIGSTTQHKVPGAAESSGAA